MEPRTYFQSIVQPTVAEFPSDTKSIRHGMLAAMVLYHMADHAALDGYAGTDRNMMDALVKDFRAGVEKQRTDFALLGDIANAAKYKRLFSRKKGTRDVTDVDQIARRPGLWEAPMGYGYP